MTMIGDAMKTSDLLTEVSKRHHVRAELSDPAFLLATVLELQVDDLVKQIGAMLQTNADHTAAASQVHLEAAQGVAEQVVSGAGKWVSEQVSASMIVAISRLDAVMTDHQAKLRRSASNAMWAAAVASAGAAVALAGVVAILVG